ncbi:TetR family transcriptional regulator [Zavarzinia aquatilis]|nr:TetR family transcriptional regulator [Zavarzinia aquatilis]
MDQQGGCDAEEGADVGDRLARAALALAAEGPWDRVSLALIARRAGVELAALYPRYGSRQAVLEAFMAMIDRAVLAGDDVSLAAEPLRDRLFDVLMRRFEALAPYRPGLASILTAERRAPLTALARLPGLARSMAWMARAAHLGDGDPDGPGWLCRGGVAAMFLSVVPVFLADDSADLSRTMVALDRRTKQAEALLRRLPSGLFRRSSAIDAT